MATRLKRARWSKVDLVDRPADGHAKILIWKRDDSEDVAKHGTHNQQSHGNRVDGPGGVGGGKSLADLLDIDVRDRLFSANSREGDEKQSRRDSVADDLSSASDALKEAGFTEESNSLSVMADDVRAGNVESDSAIQDVMDSVSRARQKVELDDPSDVGRQIEVVREQLDTNGVADIPSPADGGPPFLGNPDVLREFDAEQMVAGADISPGNVVDVGGQLKEVESVEPTGGFGGEAEVFFADGTSEIFDSARKPAPTVLRKRDFSKDQRDKLAEEGKALPDGSFPIVNKSDLSNAIQAFGRAKNKDRAKRHIIKRARALGAVDMLPDTWKISKNHNEEREGSMPTNLTPEVLAELPDDVRKSVEDLITKNEELEAKVAEPPSDDISKRDDVPEDVRKRFETLEAQAKAAEEIAKAERDQRLLNEWKQRLSRIATKLRQPQVDA